MGSIFIKLLNMSISAGYLVAAVIILRILLKKSPKWINLVLWGFVGLRLTIPFNFKSVLSLIPSAQTVVRPSSASRIEIHSGFNAFDRGANNFIAEAVAVPQITPNSENIPAVISDKPIDIMEILGFLWLCGFVFILAFSLVSFLRLKKNVSISIKIAKGIYVCDYIDIPFILGIFNPKIYLPSSLNKEDVKYVVAHERAHLKNFHNIYKPIGFLLLAVYWFNPFVLTAYVLFSKDIELACDEDVIKNYSMQEKKAYSYAILSCSSPHKIISPCPLAFGELGVKERVKKVLKYKKPGLLIVVFSVVLCVLSACLFLTDPKEDTASQDGVKPVEKENKNGATIRYPDLVSESVKTSKFYEEALRDKNAHITVNGRVVSSPEAVIRFFNDAAEGKKAAYTEYSFTDIYSKSLYKTVYTFDKERITQEVTGLKGTQENLDKEASFDELIWDRSYSHDIEYMYISDIGNIHCKIAGSSEESYLPLIDERDKFRNYEENSSVMEKYVSPISSVLLFGESFDNAEEFFKNCRYMPAADEMIRYETGESEDYPKRYSDGNMPFEDFYALMSKYFEIDKDRLYGIVKHNLNERDEFNYFGGYGGAYPDIVAEEVGTDKDVKTIFIRYFNMDGSYSENKRSELKLKIMPDGSFKYLSLKDAKCDKMEFGSYMDNTLSKFKSRNIKTSEHAMLKPMAQHDDVWWWNNYVYDLVYDMQYTYPAISEAENQVADVYRLMLYAARHNEAELSQSKGELTVKREKADTLAQKSLGTKDASHLYLDHITDKEGNMSYYVSAVYRKQNENEEGYAKDESFSITNVQYITPFICEISLSDGRSMIFEQNSNDGYILKGVEAVMREGGKKLELQADKKPETVYADNEREENLIDSMQFVGAWENEIVTNTTDGERLGLLEFFVFDSDNMKQPKRSFLAALAYGENFVDAAINQKGNLILATDHNLREYDLNGKLLGSHDLPKEYLDLTAKNINLWGSSYIFDDNCNYIAFVYPEGLFASNLKTGKTVKVCDVKNNKMLLEGGYPMEIKDGVLVFADKRSIAPCLSNAKYYDIKSETEVPSPYNIPASQDEGIQFKYVIDDKYAIGEAHGMLESQSDMEIYNIETKETIRIKDKNASVIVDGNDVYLWCRKSQREGGISYLVKADLKTGELSKPIFTSNSDSYVDVANKTVFIRTTANINQSSAMAALRL